VGVSVVRFFGDVREMRRRETVSFIRLLRYFRSYWHVIGFSLFLASIASGLGLYEAVFIKNIIDILTSKGDFNQIPALCILILLFVSLSDIVLYVLRYIQSYVQQKIMLRIRRDLFMSIEGKSFDFFDRNQTGQLVSRTTQDVEAVSHLLGTWIDNVYGLFFMYIFISAALFSINSSLAAVSLAPMAIMAYFSRRFTKQARPVYLKRQQQFGRMSAYLQQNIVGMKVVRTFLREKETSEKFKEIQYKFRDTDIKGAKLRATISSLNMSVFRGGEVLPFVYGGYLILNGNISLGTLILFYQYLSKLSSANMQIGLMVSDYTLAMAAASRFFSILDSSPAVQEKKNAIELPALEGEVRFEKVNFGYMKGRPALKNINLTVKPGETIALLGATGSGKSSLIHLIPRFYDVTSGRVTIDGYDVREVTFRSLRKQVAYVPQDTFLFSGTILRNITFGKPDATLEEAVEAAKAARAHEFITSFPKGYDTFVGERGVTLSGGQKQRLTIARAILMNPKILILDDALSFVDSKTELEIQQALRSLLKDRTCFIITQRFSMIRNADRIIVLDDGEIVEIGTHDELVAKDGIYKRIYQTQFVLQETEKPTQVKREA
jgi:ATP-binding cassette subfamily B protein